MRVPHGGRLSAGAREPPVVIAGAGIAGLTLALCLSRAGVRALVLERAARLEATGAGIQLSPNAGHVLSALGLEAAIDAVAIRPERLVVVAARSGRVIAAISYGATLARYGAPYRLVHRGDLQRLLLEAATAQGIEIRTGIEVTHAVPAAASVLVETPEGAVTAALLVGADGVSSRVRRLVRGDGEPVDTGLTAWRALVAADGAPEPPATRLALAPGSHVVRYPVAGGGAVNLVAILRDRRPGEAVAPGPLPAAFSRHAWRGLLAAASDWQPWPLRTVDPRARWWADRFVLIGDAAHAMLPFMAQGGAMAIEDAATLAAAIARAGPSPAALAAYEAARRPRAARVARESARTGAIYHLAPPVSLARDAVMRALGSERLLHRLDWLYGWRPPMPA